LPPALAASLRAVTWRRLRHGAVTRTSCRRFDGVVSAGDQRRYGQLISGSSEPTGWSWACCARRLTPCSVGAGTFRKVSRALWQAEQHLSRGGRPVRELRRKRGLRLHPYAGRVTASVYQPPPSRSQTRWVVTTPPGKRACGRLPAGGRIIAGEAPHLPVACCWTGSAPRGCSDPDRGGPSLVGELVSDGLIDELFLTLSPRLSGATRGMGAKSLVDVRDLAHWAVGESSRTGLTRAACPARVVPLSALRC